MKWIDKLQRKFRRYAVRDLMKYLTMLYGVGLLIEIIAPGFYEQYLCLNMQEVLHGQMLLAGSFPSAMRFKFNGCLDSNSCDFSISSFIRSAVSCASGTWALTNSGRKGCKGTSCGGVQSICLLPPLMTNR